jgi:mannitol/fructose-specific phosphotransferase system IIA component (Ntr-type)
METVTHPSVSHLSDYLKPGQVVFDLKATTKVAALEELLDVLQKQKVISNKKLLLTRVIDRERLETTAIGHQVENIAVAVGRSEKGIEFDALDKKKVRLVILVVWNPTLPGLFNHLFAGLAAFLSKEDFRRRAFEAKDKDELYEVLSEIELRLPREDRIISRGGLLLKLQEIEIKLKKTPKAKQASLLRQAKVIRGELDEALLTRFDRLMERYGFAVAEVENGVCQGCNINVATGMGAAIAGSNDIYICENCGKFLVAAKKKKK